MRYDRTTLTAPVPLGGDATGAGEAFTEGDACAREGDGVTVTAAAGVIFCVEVCVGVGCALGVALGVTEGRGDPLGEADGVAVTSVGVGDGNAAEYVGDGAAVSLVATEADGELD